MAYRYRFRIGQTVRVDVKGDSHHNKIGRVVQQHHARNIVQFPNEDKRDFLDDELKNA